jgi:hypothetical protein
MASPKALLAKTAGKNQSRAVVWQNKKGENESPPIRACGCGSYFTGAGVSSFVSVDVVFFVFLAPLFLVLVFVVLVVVVVSFFSGAGVVVVVVVVFSDVPAGACANAPVTNAKPINTVSAIVNTFFMFFPLLEF